MQDDPNGRRVWTVDKPDLGAATLEVHAYPNIGGLLLWGRHPDQSQTLQQWNITKTGFSIGKKVVLPAGSGVGGLHSGYIDAQQRVWLGTTGGSRFATARRADQDP